MGTTWNFLLACALWCDCVYGLPIDPHRSYLILGPANSGTNLLARLISANLPGLQQTHYLWKHSNSGTEDIYKILNLYMPQNINEMVAIAMVRSPISQIVSWKNYPYFTKYCMNRPWESMAEPCNIKVRARRGQTDDAIGSFVSFNSTMSVYNEYLRLYRTLERDGEFKRMLIFTFEDLVMNPAEVIRQIARAADVAEPAEIRLIEQSAKDHVTNRKEWKNGRNEAIDKLRSRSYLKQITKEGLRVLCSGMDRELWEGFAEGSLGAPSERVPYTADCDDFGEAVVTAADASSLASSVTPPAP
eukprot:gnl/TRDRNA2_/TRDRNA2_165649_c0_seq3.p1 gnl/TRDRNA2_/TRDRNA2_165649_c0~~gnl/TRDRNA2_/TRDRNA2_165649_c0_seq3.p1  ORF type:complete len:302 (-),score=16.34 gnl/TRDRNA2_/TRDRNA2_165649_c0_seq3:6-911(-)